MPKKPELPAAWKPKKLPKTLGACVDLAYQIRSQRLKVEAEAEGLKAEEEAVKKHILDTFEKDKIEGAKGGVGQASISRLTIPQADNWSMIYNYILKNDAFELLHKRLSDEACRERWAAGEEIPGVKKFDKIKINLSKVGAK